MPVDPDIAEAARIRSRTQPYQPHAERVPYDKTQCSVCGEAFTNRMAITRMPQDWFTQFPSLDHPFMHKQCANDLFTPGHPLSPHASLPNMAEELAARGYTV